MQNLYKTDHPNHVHQLAIAASKHYYASNDGVLKYQKKPMEAALSATSSTGGRRHMITYALRDHCSGVFYSEITFLPAKLSAKGFLCRAWNLKPNYPFCGLPRLMTIPRTVSSRFPSLSEEVEGIGIELIEVTSGFQSGVRDIRTVEDNLRLCIGEPIEVAKEWVNHVCMSHSGDAARVKGTSKIELWQHHVPEIRLPPESWGDDEKH